MTFEGLFGRRRRRRGAGHLANAFAGVAAGAGLMYFLDPGRGARRRADVAQRAGRVLHDVEASVEAGARDLRHRAGGLAHEARARVSKEAAPDEVLVERVRAKLGRVTTHARAVDVAAQGGRVTLSGPVFAAEHGRVLRSVRLVRGVRSVEDRLEPHDTAEGVSALQGGGPSPGPRPELLQRTWAPGARLLAGSVGAFLAARALFGRSAGRIPAGIAGAALLGKIMGGPGTVRREARRVARDASAAASRETERRKEGEAHRGAWHPEPEVREVKSPAELERGVASASPEPTFESRVSRRGKERARKRSKGLDAAAGAEASAPAPGSEDVTSRGDYLAPDEGAGVREGDLGTTRAVEESSGESEAEGGAAERKGPHEPGAAWRDPGDTER
jgi:hypothetical protein